MARAKALQRIANMFFLGKYAAGKRALRLHIRQTIGFQELSKRSKLPLPRLTRMFSPKGRLRMREFFTALAVLQRDAGIELHIAAE
jgi:hypothetical protein